MNTSFSFHIKKKTNQCQNNQNSFIDYEQRITKSINEDTPSKSLSIQSRSNANYKKHNNYTMPEQTTSSYALRDTTSSSNRRITIPSHSSSDYPYYTEKDPQYYIAAEGKGKKSRRRASATKKKGLTDSGMSMPPLTILPGGSSVGVEHEVEVESSARLGAVEELRFRTPNANDVLCGRGGNINQHLGNITYRSYVQELKNKYNLTTNKEYKASISQSIVDRVHRMNPPGRFLKKESGGDCYWVEVDNAKAVSKTSQALREGAPTIRALAAKTSTSVSSSKKKTSSRRKTSSRGGGAKNKAKGGKKRKRPSPVVKQTRDDTSDGNDSDYHPTENEDEEYDPVKHPLILPMPNGHRGKQLIRRADIYDADADATVDANSNDATDTRTMWQADENAKVPLTPSKRLKTEHQLEFDTTSTPCISFDEDFHHQGEEAAAHSAIVSTSTSNNATMEANAKLPAIKNMQRSYHEAKTPPPQQTPEGTPSLLPLPAPTAVTTIDNNDQQQQFALNQYSLPPPSSSVNGSSSSCNIFTIQDPTKLPQLPQRPSMAMYRAHSLAFSEKGSEQDNDFKGDEKFINPFLDDSKVIAGLYKNSKDYVFNHAGHLVGNGASSSVPSNGSRLPIAATPVAASTSEPPIAATITPALPIGNGTDTTFIRSVSDSTNRSMNAQSMTLDHFNSALEAKRENDSSSTTMPAPANVTRATSVAVGANAQPLNGAVSNSGNLHPASFLLNAHRPKSLNQFFHV